MEYSIRIGEKKFTFKKVNILCSEMYGEIAGLALSYNGQRTEAEEIDLAYTIAKAEAETAIEKAQARSEQLKASKNLTKDGREMTKEMHRLQYVILAELLDINGYEYDESYWKKNASIEDVNDVIVEAVGGGSKKKVVESST
jgi:hypothetical protein